MAGFHAGGTLHFLRIIIRPGRVSSGGTLHLRRIIRPAGFHPGGGGGGHFI